MKDAQRKSWYSEVVAAYTSQQRKNWYSEVADAYNKVRPRYPHELINSAVQLAHLPAEAIILEIGCGPGTATTAFAQLGFAMICLEPSQEACLLARQNCAAYPNVEIINTTFEEWQLEAKKFNAVLAANSFHWVAPEIGYPKAAAALKDNGSLILMWNKEPQLNYEIYQALNEVYQAHNFSLPRYEDKETQEEILRWLGENIISSGLFKDLRYAQLACEVTYSIDDYLALLSTLSPYIRLEQQQRDSLFVGLSKVLQKYGNLETSYLSAFHIAKKS